MSPHDNNTKNPLLLVAEDILAQVQGLVEHMSTHSISPPSLQLGSHTELWTSHPDKEILSRRNALVGLTQRLDKLVLGPHGFLHEYVSANWELGALYTLMEHGILEKIPLIASESSTSILAGDEVEIVSVNGQNGTKKKEKRPPSIHVDKLIEGTPLPAEKLLRMCRLLACAGVLEETGEDGFFAHTVISEELVRDPGFAAWVGFQLFETRVASAHLSDSLQRPNPFWTGQPAFEYAWGKTMYKWHADHPPKAKRFAQAMQSVSKSLDPGDGLITNWLVYSSSSSSSSSSSNPSRPVPVIIHIEGKTGSFAADLARQIPNLTHEIWETSGVLIAKGQEEITHAGLEGRITFRQRELFFDPAVIVERTGMSGPVVVILLRGVLWCLDDGKVVDLLQSYLPLLTSNGGEGRNDMSGQGPKSTLLICDLVSPARGTFPPHVERAFRRRDVTLMTMHNAKQRTRAEWEVLLEKALGENVSSGGGGESEGSKFAVVYQEGVSDHSCRGLWAVSRK